MRAMARFKRHMLTKIIIVTICQAIALLPGFSTYSNPPEEIRINRRYGRVIKSDNGEDSSVRIIHIQDAHCVEEAQRNIAGILKDLAVDYDIKLIGVEGASGKFNTDKIAQFPHKEILNKTSDFFLKNGKLTGSEYFSINENKNLLLGIENPDLYLENYNSLLKSLAVREAAVQYFHTIRSDLELLKEQYLSEDVQRFNHEIMQAREVEKDFVKYTLLLKHYAEKKGVSKDKYPDFKLFIATMELESSIDFDSITREKAELVDKLSEVLPKTEIAQLLQQNLYYNINKITPSEYYGFLAEKAEQAAIENETYPNFYKYAEYLKSYDSIDQKNLFAECSSLASEINSTLCVTDSDAHITQLLEDQKIIEKYTMLQLTSEELSRFTKKPAEIIREFDMAMQSYSRKMNLNYAANAELFSVLASGLPLLEEFYTLAKKRDKALVDRLLAEMDLEGIDTAVLIAGGFHTEGIVEKLKDEGVAYDVIIPEITKEQEYNPYYSLVTNQRDGLEEFLSSNTLQLALRTAKLNLVDQANQLIFARELDAMMAVLFADEFDSRLMSESDMIDRVNTALVQYGNENNIQILGRVVLDGPFGYRAYKVQIDNQVVSFVVNDSSQSYSANENALFSGIVETAHVNIFAEDEFSRLWAQAAPLNGITELYRGAKNAVFRADLVRQARFAAVESLYNFGEITPETLEDINTRYGLDVSEEIRLFIQQYTSNDPTQSLLSYLPETDTYVWNESDGNLNLLLLESVDKLMGMSPNLPDEISALGGALGTVDEIRFFADVVNDANRTTTGNIKLFYFEKDLPRDIQLHVLQELHRGSNELFNPVEGGSVSFESLNNNVYEIRVTYRPQDDGYFFRVGLKENAVQRRPQLVDPSFAFVSSPVVQRVQPGIQIASTSPLDYPIVGFPRIYIERDAGGNSYLAAKILEVDRTSGTVKSLIDTVSLRFPLSDLNNVRLVLRDLVDALIVQSQEQRIGLLKPIFGNELMRLIPDADTEYSLIKVGVASLYRPAQLGAVFLAPDGTFSIEIEPRGIADNRPAFNDLVQIASTVIDKTIVERFVENNDREGLLNLFYASVQENMKNILTLLQNKYVSKSDNPNQTIHVSIKLGSEKLAQAHIDDTDQLRLEINAHAFRSPGLLYAQLEHEIRHEIIGNSVRDSLAKFVQADQVSPEFAGFLAELYIAKKELERYREFGRDAELGEKTQEVLLAPDNPIDPNGEFVSIIQLPSDQQQAVLANLVAQRYFPTAAAFPSPALIDEVLADIETKLAEKELNGLFSVVLNPAGNFVEWTQENREKSATIARTLIDSHSFYIPYISSVKIDGVISNQKVNGIGMRGSIGADTTILGDAISIGDEVQIGRGVKILSEGGTVIIENGVRLEDGVVIRAKIGETIRIGAGTEILQGAELSGNVSIGEGAVIDRSQIKNAVIKSEIGNPVVIRNSLVWGETGAENDLVLIETGVQIDYSTIRTESEKKSLNLLENAYTPTLLYDSYIVAPEKTIIQSGARIEQATVVNSEIGKKVTIREHANIAHSIFKDGSGARVNTRTFLSYFGREVQVGSTITRSYFGDGVVSEHQGTKIDFLLLPNEYPIVDELGNRKTIRLPNTTNIGAGTIIENNTKQPIIGYHLFTGVNSRITAKPDTLNIIYPLTLTKGEVGGVIAPFAYSQTPDRYIDAWMLSDYPGAIINHLKKTKSLVTKLNYPMADFDQFINGSIRLAFRPFDGSRTPSALLDGLQASFASGPEAQKIARYLQAQVLSGAWDMKDGELVNGMFEWAPGDKWSTNDLREFLSWDENKLRDFRDNYTELKAVFREQEAYAPVSIKSKAEMGTDGLRGVASSDRFIDNAHITPVIAYRLGLVAALHAMTEGKKHIRVAGDTRPSTSELLTAFISGATQLGITVIQDGQNVPGQEAVSTTPQEQYYVMNDPLAGGGAVITASHNPARDNGIKLLNAAGAKIPAQWENIANLVVNSSNLPHTLAYIIEQLGGRTARYEPLFEGAPAVTERAVSEQYFDEILDALRVLVPPSDTERVITVDAANGAGSYAMAHLAERIAAEMPELKFRLHVINAGDGVINEQAGAEYIHKKLSKDIAAGKTLPVWLEPLKGQMVGTLDGDADRNLLFRLNEDNSLEVIDGDKFAAMKVLVLQKYMKELGLDAQFKVGVAQTVLANTGSKILYDRLGIEPTKTAVGDKYVRDAADQWVKEHGVAVYYEAAGHGSILFSDAFISAVKAAEESPAKNILSAIVAMQNLAGGDGIRNLVLFLALMEREGLDFNQLNDPAFLYNENPKVELELKVAYKDNVTTEQNGALLTGPQDVIDALTEWKNRLGDDYTFIIRKSGTSPKVRVQVEGPDAGRVEEAAYSLMQAIYDSPTVIGDPKEPRPLGLLAAINENRAREEQAKQLRVFQQENLIPITDRVRALFVEDTLNAIAERGEGQVTVGTDGIRGKFDSSNDLKKKLITKPIAYRMGITAALHALSEGKDVIHIAGDTRESTPVLLQSFIVGATQMGVSVKVHGLDSVASTPQVQLFTQIDSLAGGGGVITASHNPAPDNGIKLINAEGEKISEEWEQITNEIVNSEDLPATIGRVISMFQTDGRPDMSKIDRAVNGIALRRQTSDQQYKEIPNVEMLGNDALNRYVQQIVDAMVNLNKIESARYDGSAPNAPNTVLIDATFGAGQVALEQVRDTVNRMNDQGALNFRIELINSGTGVVNYQTGAEFIHKDLADELAAGEPLPQWIEQNKGKWIFTIDGDADRSLIFQVTEDNQVQVIDGDKLAALKVMVLNKYINALGLQDRFTVGVAQTDLANPSAKSFFENLGAHRDQTPVGDKYVSASAKEWARDHGLAVYYEAAGHGSIAFNEEFRQAVREFDPTNATPSQIEAAQILNNIMSLQNTAGGDGVMNVLLLAMITRLENLKLDADLLYKEAPKKELSETVDNKDVVTSVEGRGIELTGPADLIEKVNQTKAAYKEKLEQLIKEGHITRAELPIPDFEVIIRKSGTSPVMRVQVNGPIQELVDEMSYELMDFIYKHPVINPSADPAKAPALKYEQVVANKQAELEASLTVSAEDIRAYVLGGDKLSEKEIFELRIDLTRNGWTSQSLAQLIAVHRKGGDVAVEPPAARAVFSAPDMIDISQTSAVRPDKVALGAQKDVVDRSALVLLAGGDGSRLLGSMGFADDQKALWAKPTIPVTAIAAKPPLQRIIETVASIRRQQQSNIPIVIVVGPRSKGPIKAFLDAHNNFGIENIILVEQDKNPVVKATAENQEGKLVVTPNLDIEYSPNGTGGIVDAMGKPVKVQGTDFQSAAQYLGSVNRDKVIFWGGDVGGLTTELFYGILGVSKGLTGSEDVDVVGLAYPSKNKDLGTMVKMNNQTVLVIEKSDRSSYAGLEEADDTQGELNGLPRNSGGYLMSLDAIREVIGNFPVHLQANKDIEGYDPSTGQPVAKADKMETFFPDIFPLVSENRDMKIIIAVADEKDMVPQKSVPQLDRGRQELIQQDKNRLLAEHEVLIADSAVVELSPLFAGSFGSDVRLDSNAEFYIGENVFVGENVLFGEGTRVQGENIRIGNNVRIIEGASIIVEGSGELVIEDGAVIADNTRIVIKDGEKVVIGKNAYVSLAVLTGSNRVGEYSVIEQGSRIDNVQIGSNSRVSDSRVFGVKDNPVVIGSNTVISERSLITSSQKTKTWSFLEKNDLREGFIPQDENIPLRRYQIAVKQTRIGDGTTIANARLNNTEIGNNVEVQPGVAVEFSHIGNGTQLRSNTNITISWIGERAVIGSEVSKSWLGNGFSTLDQNSYISLIAPNEMLVLNENFELEIIDFANPTHIGNFVVFANYGGKPLPDLSGSLKGTAFVFSSKIGEANIVNLYDHPDVHLPDLTNEKGVTVIYQFSLVPSGEVWGTVFPFTEASTLSPASHKIGSVVKNNPRLITSMLTQMGRSLNADQRSTLLNAVAGSLRLGIKMVAAEVSTTFPRVPSSLFQGQQELLSKVTQDIPSVTRKDVAELRSRLKHLLADIDAKTPATDIARFKEVLARWAVDMEPSEQAQFELTQLMRNAKKNLQRLDQLFEGWDNYLFGLERDSFWTQQLSWSGIEMASYNEAPNTLNYVSVYSNPNVITLQDAVIDEMLNDPDTIDEILEILAGMISVMTPAERNVFDSVTGPEGTPREQVAFFNQIAKSRLIQVRNILAEKYEGIDDIEFVIRFGTERLAQNETGGDKRIILNAQALRSPYLLFAEAEHELLHEIIDSEVNTRVDGSALNEKRIVEAIVRQNILSTLRTDIESGSLERMVAEQTSAFFDSLKVFIKERYIIAKELDRIINANAAANVTGILRNPENPIDKSGKFSALINQAVAEPSNDKTQMLVADYVLQNYPGMAGMNSILAEIATVQGFIDRGVDIAKYGVAVTADDFELLRTIIDGSIFATIDHAAGITNSFGSYTIEVDANSQLLAHSLGQEELAEIQNVLVTLGYDVSVIDFDIFAGTELTDSNSLFFADTLERISQNARANAKQPEIVLFSFSQDEKTMRSFLQKRGVDLAAVKIIDRNTLIARADSDQAFLDIHRLLDTARSTENYEQLETLYANISRGDAQAKSVGNNLMKLLMELVPITVNIPELDITEVKFAAHNNALGQLAVSNNIRSIEWGKGYDNVQEGDLIEAGIDNLLLLEILEPGSEVPRELNVTAVAQGKTIRGKRVDEIFNAEYNRQKSEADDSQEFEPVITIEFLVNKLGVSYLTKEDLKGIGVKAPKRQVDRGYMQSLQSQRLFDQSA